MVDFPFIEAKSAINKMFLNFLLYKPILSFAGSIYLFASLLSGKATNPRSIFYGTIMSGLVGLSTLMILEGLGVETRLACGVAAMIGSTGNSGRKLLIRVIEKRITGKEDNDVI